jgi:hypothetical protein
MLALVELTRALLGVHAPPLAMSAHLHHFLDRFVNHLCPDRVHYDFSGDYYERMREKRRQYDSKILYIAISLSLSAGQDLRPG